VAKIFHKGFGVVSQYSLHIESLDEIDLRIPTSLFENALAYVVVAGGTGKGEVVSQ
jgi:hypothetical protein